MSGVLALPHRAAMSIGRGFITAEDIANGLGGRKSGANWQARCPAHDDKTPSLSLRDGDHGRPIFHCFGGCSQREVIDALISRGLWPDHGERREWRLPPIRPKPRRQEPDNGIIAARVWRESVDAKGSWAEEYLIGRGLKLPDDAEVRCRTLRLHPACWFPDGTKAPALIAAFTQIETVVPRNPFFDPPVTAIRRIRGRGGDNKAMLGPVTGKAIMLSPWWHVTDTLHIAEGVETSLALYGEGVRPIWAAGSKGAIERFPVIDRVKTLRIFADNDANGEGVAKARECTERWRQAGKRVVIRYLEEPGRDYAD